MKEDFADLNKKVESSSRFLTHPWTRFPKIESTKGISVLCPLSLTSDLNVDEESVLEKLRNWKTFFEDQNLAFEFLLVPYGDNRGDVSVNFSKVWEFLKENSSFLMMNCGFQVYRADALREAFLLSSGEVLVCVDFEQPCDLSFFRSAILHVIREYDFVRGNRRIPGARFRTPVRLLPFAYKRYALSSFYNRLVRNLFRFEIRDVHSTNYVLSRSFALEVFSLQRLRDMSFELELAIIAKLREIPCLDLPLRYFLNEEKSKKRLFKESFLLLKNLWIVSYRYFRGYYDSFSLNNAISADDWGLTSGVNGGILALAKQGVVKRVALMATEEFLEEGLEELKALPEVELGLHFNLTHGIGQPFGHRGPLSFLFYWMKNRASLKQRVRAEFEKQILKLNQVGVRPVYMDAHHHMHLAPGLIDDIGDLLKKHHIRDVRLPYDPTLLFTSKFIINLLSLWAGNSFDRLKLRSRKCFYPLKKDFLDQARLRARLSRTEGYEVIVHPANKDDVRHLKYKDSYSADRILEYQALAMLNLQGLKKDPKSHSQKLDLNP